MESRPRRSTVPTERFPLYIPISRREITLYIHIYKRDMLWHKPFLLAASLTSRALMASRLDFTIAREPDLSPSSICPFFSFSRSFLNLDLSTVFEIMVHGCDGFGDWNLLIKKIPVITKSRMIKRNLAPAPSFSSQLKNCSHFYHSFHTVFRNIQRCYVGYLNKSLAHSGTVIRKIIIMRVTSIGMLGIG